MFPRHALAAALALLAGAAAALLLAPALVRASHADAARLCAIVDACRSANAPRIAVFGNSVAMFGVDASRLRAWNLASPEQSLAESRLLQTQLPAAVRTVVQLVSPRQLAENVSIDPDHRSAIEICGARPSFRARLEARRHIRAGLEGLARDLLRRDSDHGRMLRDLSFPAPKGQRGGWVAARLFAERENEPRGVNAAQLALLRESARKHEYYLVVLVPLHPQRRATRVSCPPGLPCADLSELLAAEEFLDPRHPTRAGAARLTDAIGRELAARRLLLRE